MPSPVGHALGGLIVGLTTLPRGGLERERPIPTRDLWITVVAACLPDIDFLWGRHSAETHSVGFAALVGIAVFAVAKMLRDAGAARLGWAAALAVGSHVLFDWLGSDDFPPLGVMALWPISSEFSFAHAYVFDTISRRYALANFWPHNIAAVMKEIVMLAPVAGVLYWLRRR